MYASRADTPTRSRFTSGAASGDPSSGGVVLDQGEVDDEIELAWEIADDEGFRSRSPAVERKLIDANPHIHWAETDSHGYLLVDVTRERVEARWYSVDTLVRPSDGVHIGRAWAVRRGSHTPEPVTG